jgi:ectoine hydroxylase-related dioxygenase (phytanoyl-CoA dioxygenase family)
MPLLDAGDAGVERLRARAKEDGYLFFRQLLPPADVLRLRADMLAVVERHGWLENTGDDRVAVHVLEQVPESAMRTDIGVTHVAYDDIQKLESFHRLPHHPRLVSLFQTLFGREVLVHPRHIARLVTPHPAMVPTPLHQDFPLIQGTTDTWTCWLPIGDCPRDMGGLAVLRGSHRAGYMPVQPAQGAGAIAAQTCPGDGEWVEGDYAAGDVLIFTCFTAHKALRCQFPDRIRLSLDVRYQPADEPVEARSLLPHCDLSWDEIYADWQREDLKYYWRGQVSTLSPWNPSFVQPSRRIC